MEFNKPDWKVSPFFPLAGKKPMVKWKEINNRTKFSELNDFESLAFVPPQGFIIVDADDDESTKLIEELNTKLNIKPVSYNTTRGRHFIYRKPEGEYFDAIASQNGGTAFLNKEYDSSKIDLKASGMKGEKEVAGYVKVKDSGKWRIEPQDLMNAFNEDTPFMPLMLSLTKKFKFSVEEYKVSPRDDYVFRKIAIFRSKKWTKEQFEKFCVELKLMANDKETIDETIEWANKKWESSLEQGKVKDMTKDIKTWNEFVEENAVESKKKKKEKPTHDDSGNDLFKYIIWKLLDKKNNVWRAEDIKELEKLSHAMIKETKLQYSAEDDQIWGIQIGEFQPIKNGNLKLFVKRWLIKEFGNVKPGVMNTLESYIQGAIPIKKFDNNELYIKFNNRTIDIMTNKDVELDEHHMSQNLIPNNLITKSQYHSEEYKEAREWLQKTMSAWTLSDKKLQKQIYERVGLWMTKYLGHEKSYFFLGNAENGKSQFFNLVSNAIGSRNISNRDLKDLSTDKFASSDLYGKLININGDISANVIEDPSLFKKIVTGDRLAGQFKNSNSFSFSPYANLAFGANNIPHARELGDSDGVTRRLEIIPFLAKFDSNDITEKEKVAFKKMIRDEKVIEVFIYKSISAAHKAFNSKFFTSPISNKIFNETMKEFNHLHDFIVESGVKENESILDAHKRYKEWAKGYDYKYYGLREFNKKYINIARHYGIKIVKETFDGDTSNRHRLIKVNNEKE